MIVGMGLDMCQRDRVEAIINRFGDRFCHRILADNELAELDKFADKSAFVARRIAAKEAVAKALGTGIAKGVGWHEIEVGHLPSGQPLALLSGAAAQRVHDLGIDRVHLSITDERNMAAAVAVIEKDS